MIFKIGLHSSGDLQALVRWLKLWTGSGPLHRWCQPECVLCYQPSIPLALILALSLWQESARKSEISSALEDFEVNRN
jgi:hypothetical protein